MEWDVRFRVGECKAGNLGVGTVLVRERREGKGWILIGKGRGDGEVRVGCLVGVREPSWEVEVQGEVWRIGVEWRVLDG